MNCGEIARARGVFEVAVTQPSLDMPELLWKHYIDLEISEGKQGRAEQRREGKGSEGGFLICTVQCRQYRVPVLDKQSRTGKGREGKGVSLVL